MVPITLIIGMILNGGISKMKKHKAFTMVELIMYIALVAVIVTLLTKMTLDLINARQRANKQKELIQNMRYIGERIFNEIKLSTDVLEIGENYILLSSSEQDVGLVRIEYTNGEIRMGRGNEGDCNAYSPCNVIGQGLVVSSFSFTDRTKTGQTNHTVSYSFSIKLQDESNAKKLDFEPVYSTTVSNEVTKPL